MAEPFAGTVMLVHSANTGPGRPRSTLTLSMVRAEPVGLSRRIAPARYAVPPPIKLTEGLLSFHGSGKLAVADELSAKPTDTGKGKVPDCSNNGYTRAELSALSVAANARFVNSGSASIGSVAVPNSGKRPGT